MKKLYLIYSNSKLPLSPIIRYVTKSEFSHVAIILEKSIIEITKDSLVTHSALSSKGLKFTTLKTFISHATKYRVTELNVGIDEHQFYLLNAFAKMYEGTPYDLEGAIGLGINENWQDDDKFWCSEWVAFLCKLIGLDLAYLDDVHRITPKHNLDWEQTTISIGV